MRGSIRSVASASSQGVILGDDGSRYTFTIQGWRDESSPAVEGMVVEFENRGTRATGVRPVPGMPLTKPEIPVEYSPASPPTSVDLDYPKTLEAPKVQDTVNLPTPVQAPVSPYPVYTMTQVGAKSKTTTAMLAFFLGAFGAHKFYLGYVQAGLMYLGGVFGFSVGFWIFAILFRENETDLGIGTIIGAIIMLVSMGWTATFWIISCIEGVTYLSKSDNEFNDIYVLGRKSWF